MAEGHTRAAHRGLRPRRPSRHDRREAAARRHAGDARRSLAGGDPLMRTAAALTLLALSGCASQSLSIRTQPEQTPAADAAAAPAHAQAFAEAAGNAPSGEPALPPDAAPVT